MKKFIIAIAALLLSSNANASPWGSGDFKLTDRGVDWFVYYVQSPGGKKHPRAKGIRITYTEDGNNAWYNYCDGNPTRCVSSSITQLNAKCQRKYNQPCKGFAVGNRIKWVNGINPGGKDASFKRSDSIDEIVDKLGFYE